MIEYSNTTKFIAYCYINQYNFRRLISTIFHHLLKSLPINFFFKQNIKPLHILSTESFRMNVKKMSLW